MKVLDAKEMELVSGGFLPALASLIVAAYPFMIETVLTFGAYSFYMYAKHGQITEFDDYMTCRF
ncbi:MAG: hypothetical protein V4490_06580 [Pseudomonadota bacterium]